MGAGVSYDDGILDIMLANDGMWVQFEEYIIQILPDGTYKGIIFAPGEYQYNEPLPILTTGGYIYSVNYAFDGILSEVSAYDVGSTPLSGNWAMVGANQGRMNRNNGTSIPTEYTVTFESNGGTAVSAQTVPSGEKATKPIDPTKERFTFVNWYTDEALTIVYDFGAPVTENIVLYAGWKEDAEPSPTPTPTPSPSPTPTGNPTPPPTGDSNMTLGVLLLIMLTAAGAFYLIKRNKA